MLVMAVVLSSPSDTHNEVVSDAELSIVTTWIAKGSCICTTYTTYVHLAADHAYA